MLSFGGGWEGRRGMKDWQGIGEGRRRQLGLWQGLVDKDDKEVVVESSLE